ncbi:hypothetical protein HPB51_019015 [Rhipicephalus microplus]|uniref:Peptidase M13 N-terminal domain-containing protein n=1 Tax=Rhipicephalus microplus TaxID=6941 RepID=A0A9J6D6L9_RHIMP|nr:hypothetical protein HPB51_019015 [Rhipicephalus microplus]
MSWFYSRHQVCGLFCGTGMLFVPLLIVLIILLTRRNPRTQLEYCTSAACAKALASLHTLMDETVDPCHDFHAHVCGRWDSVTGGRMSYVDESVRRTAGRIIRALLDVDARRQTLPFETRLVAKFYQLCSSFMVEPSRERADILRPFVGLYDNLLNIRHYSDLLVSLTNLSLAQGVHTVFGVKLVRTTGESSVVVFPGKTLEQKIRPSFAAPFDEYLTTVVSDVGKYTGSLPGTFDMHDLMQVEGRVERMLPNKSSENGRRQLDVPMLSALNKALSSDGWLAALNAPLPKNQKLIDNSSVTVDAFSSVQNVLRLFGDLPDHGVAYLYLNVLSDGLRFDYLRTLQHNKSDIDASLACLQASAEATWVTRNVVANLIFGSHGDGGTVTTDLFSLVRESVLTTSASFRWMGNAMQRHTKRSLSTISLRLHDWSDSNATGEASDAILAGVTPAEFPSTYMRLRRDQQQRFLADTDLKLAAGDDIRLFMNKTQFDVEANALIVPASLRVQPLLYPRDVPPEFVAGTLGVLMAKEVHRAVVFNHTSEFWGNRERKAVARFEQCTRVLASTLNATPTTQSVHVGEPSPYVLWMVAASTAFEALRLASRSFRGTSNVARYWKPAQQTFFRRFCLLTCGNQDDNAEDGLTSRLFCLLPTANMPQFAEAFDCPANYEEAFCVLE